MSSRDWPELFARLRSAQAELDPQMIGSARLGPFEGPPDLLALYRAAEGNPTLDESWFLLESQHALKMKQDMDDCEADWVPFASDGGESRLLLDTRSGEVIRYCMDPPGQKSVAPSLHAWLVDLVERLENRVRRLPPNHKLNLALLEAVEKNDLQAARDALDLGADPDTSVQAGRPPIFTAISRKNLDAVELLLDRGVDPNQRETYYGKTPIIEAAVYAAERPRARRGEWPPPPLPADLRILMLLLRRGADINARTVLGTGINSELGVGDTALIEAVKHDFTDVVALLLEHGADPNLANEFFGFTPLMYAIRHRNLETVDRLLAAGADPNRVSQKGQRTLQIAMDEYTGTRKVPIDERIVQRLRERGAF